MAAKTHIAVMAWTAGNRIAKYQGFDLEVDAEAHVVNFTDSYPEAFVVRPPVQGDVDDWLVDPVAKALSYNPLPVIPSSLLDLNVDSLVEILIAEGVITQAQIDAKKA